MTKETKIGLLVGMGFIILIGILVSDHLSEAQKQISPNMRGMAADMVHDPMPESLNTNTQYRNTPQTPPHIFRTDELPLPNEKLPRNNYQPDNRAGAATPNPLINSPVARNQIDLEPYKTVMGTYNRSGNTGTINPNHATSSKNNNTNAGRYFNSNKENNSPNIPGFTKQQNSQFSNVPNNHSVNPKRPKIGPTQEDKALQTANANVRVHHVQKSDTLSGISKKYYGTVKHWELIQLYNIKLVPNSNFVREGIRLVIPELKKKKTDTASKKKAPVTSRNTAKVLEKKLPQDSQTMNYTIKKGDMLSKIAAKFYGTQSAWPKLYKLNKSVIEKPDALKPGTVIRVPRKK